MTIFLATYASSIKISTPKISDNWFRTANKTFSEDYIYFYDYNSNDNLDNADDDVYYDKLIMACTFKETLMTYRADFESGCPSSGYSLTSNGLCHTFNGIEASNLLKPKWKYTEIITAFKNIFEEFQTPKMTFRGIGDSEGNLLIKSLID